MEIIKIEQRKISPVAGMISAGKSKFLNVLCNFNFLECKSGIATKFVNIIRYNPNIPEPKFYHLKLKKKGDQYIFYKDKSFEEKIGNKAIIEENKNINNKLAEQTEIKYEEIFYMTEINEVSFIINKNFLLTHDLCDIPGLSEYQPDNKEKVENENPDEKLMNGIERIRTEAMEFGFTPIDEENNIEKENKDNDNDEECENIEIKKNTYISEIFGILKPYIDKGIIILSLENFYFEENYEIISKLHKILEKEIKDFLIILNKIDLSTNKEKDINKCIGQFFQKFTNTQIFNLNLNTFVPLSTYQLQNELLMENSFKHLINYHFLRYLSFYKNTYSNTPTDYSFIQHLSELLAKFKLKGTDFGQKIKSLDKEENIRQINMQIKNIIEEILNKYSSEGINLGITPEEINEDNSNEEEESDELESENTKDNFINVAPVNILKMFYIYFKEKNLIPPISEETEKLIDFFKEKTEIKEINTTIKSDEKMNQSLLDEKRIKLLQKFCVEIKNSKLESEMCENLPNEIENIIKFSKIYNMILIPFLGASNAGKTTIINDIIGFDLLPTDLNECTKRGIIIKYSNDNEITIRKANFKEKTSVDKKEYYFEEGEIIGKGIEQVQKTLKGLNYNYTENEKNYFYYVYTKIKLFDEIKLDDKLKNIIYLIDFPGFGTGNQFEKKNIYNKVLSICNSFVFVVRNATIKDNKTYEVLTSIFEQAKQQKKKLTSQFIKSCLFIFNNDNNQPTNENALEKAKEDIQILINGTEKNDINACFFNAKFYLNYINSLNYFSDIDQLFEIERKNYLRNKYDLFNTGLSNRFDPDTTFIKYLNNKLIKKNKKDFEKGITKKQIIIENIENKVNENLEELIKYNINKNDCSDKNKTTLIKILSFAAQNIHDLKTKNCKDVEKFSQALINQINFINNNIKEEFKTKVVETIEILDMYFNRNFSEAKKKESDEVGKFKLRFNGVLTNLKKTFDNLNIEKIVKTNEKIITDSLNKKKSEFSQTLKNKKFDEVLNDIKSEINNSLRDVNSELNKNIDKFEEESSIYYNEIKVIINSFIGEKECHLKQMKSLRSEISKNIGNKNKDLSEELMNEFKNSCEGLYNIWNRKGFKNWISSLFSNEIYLSLVIDMMIETIMSKLNYLSKLISEQYELYKTQVMNSIKNSQKASLIEFSKSQLVKWELLRLSYGNIKSHIKDAGFL